ncbi:hypothetical protein NLM33_25135 [Bradyrhizobium sp. CCGUVB1N3]|uniref:hypothetical protein n=1 Tax=Bradyrhizobium sp. CCGUVB1N3 TaxID=2949629 RepID=UPI0020B26E23|nr:hypothetical protein [Bradyrhizobium sp. CCGUVB1N3]MCP3471821.1 hypothetical protein [Bradyrhizobium sp. CCGUVB1N3]MCP3473603.1 hypothetical protein [Bradyrhizobium sp. CCGUVB1N3]
MAETLPCPRQAVQVRVSVMAVSGFSKSATLERKAVPFARGRFRFLAYGVVRLLSLWASFAFTGGKMTIAGFGRNENLGSLAGPAKSTIATLGQHNWLVESVCVA